MPKPRKKQEVQGVYYRWLMGTRQGVYFADGRSNTPALGRQSLGTRCRDEALQATLQLDLQMAVQHGLASPELLRADGPKPLTLVEGRRLYENYVRRPAVANGPQKSTAKRYRAVLDKFLTYCEQCDVKYWNHVNRELFDGYAAWLDDESYAYATAYLELTTLKQILKFLVREERLPAAAIFSYSLRKPMGTDTYCWTEREVVAIVRHCEAPPLQWLRSLVFTLARTGMRISELAGLRWSDMDLNRDMITLPDERSLRSRSGRERRTTKSGRSRSFPIHPELKQHFASLEHHSDGRVFHGPLGGRIKPDNVRRCLIRDVLNPLAKEFPAPSNQPGFADGRLHSFRHYFCSVCSNTNIPERMLMDWLGHQNSKLVHRYYHLQDEESHRQMQRLGPIGSKPDSA